ncbi:putative Cytochrome P450 [Seiridium cardinale]
MVESVVTSAAQSLSRRTGTSRIDTHIHVLTPSFVKALEDNGGDPSGWTTPSWTLEECVRFSDTIGASFSVLSVTAPGPALLGPTEEGRKLARALNEEVWDVCCQRRGRFGFFASLPDFNDVEGTLEELRHVFEVEKRANGVIVMTSYGDKLIGDESFKPIWEMLNKHSALVFVHPGHVNITPAKISGFLPQPVIDYPQATTRAAMSLLLSGIMTDFTSIEVILSHAGGTFPYLGQRAIGSLVDPMIAQNAKVNVVQAKLAASRFWYDIALSTSEPQLKALLAFTSPSKILYGSDFPYAPRLGIYGVVEIFKPMGKRKGRNGQKPRLPPGPAGVPILGSLAELRSIRKDPEHKLLKGLAKYGEMTTLHMGQKTWILLNSHRVVSEIIAKRSGVTNTRSPMPVSSGIVSHDRRSLLLPQETWTERRRVMHSLLSGTALRQYGEWQETESTQMMAEYVFKPELWYKHHYRYANSVVHRITLGDRLVKSTKELADLQNCVTFFVGSIGKSMVDWFPDVAKLPKFLHFWAPQWERLAQWNYDVYKSWYEPVRKQVEDGTAPPSFVRDILLHPDTKYTGDNEDSMYVAMQLIEAGSDTTREALNTMIMASLEHPEPFRKARAEIDRVCGVGAEARLPILNDMEDLRYICAMAKEVLRWRPLFILTPDHTSSQDIDFEGYHFPAGVSFIINEVAVGNECEDPEAFKPERWMDGHETDIAHGLWQFGGGRRICVGYRLAQRSLFINIARLVQCIDFKAVSRSSSLLDEYSSWSSL